MVAVGAAYYDYVVLYYNGHHFVDDYMMGMSPNIIMYDLCAYDMVGLRTCVYTF